jgi:hypothetical protein
MVRAAGEHPSLKFNQDFVGYLRVFENARHVRVDFHELPEVALRAFNSDVRSV